MSTYTVIVHGGLLDGKRLLYEEDPGPSVEIPALLNGDLTSTTYRRSAVVTVEGIPVAGHYTKLDP